MAPLGQRPGPRSAAARAGSGRCGRPPASPSGRRADGDTSTLRARRWRPRKTTATAPVGPGLVPEQRGGRRAGPARWVAPARGRAAVRSSGRRLAGCPRRRSARRYPSIAFLAPPEGAELERQVALDRDREAAARTPRPAKRTSATSRRRDRLAGHVAERLPAEQVRKDAAVDAGLRQRPSDRQRWRGNHSGRWARRARCATRACVSSAVRKQRSRGSGGMRRQPGPSARRKATPAPARQCRSLGHEDRPRTRPDSVRGGGAVSETREAFQDRGAVESTSGRGAERALRAAVDGPVEQEVVQPECRPEPARQRGDVDRRRRGSRRGARLLEEPPGLRPPDFGTGLTGAVCGLPSVPNGVLDRRVMQMSLPVSLGWHGSGAIRGLNTGGPLSRLRLLVATSPSTRETARRGFSAARA